MSNEQTITEDTVKACFAIAKKHGIETLESRDSDSLDFHELSVWDIEEMLHEAYEQGRAAAISATAS